MIYFAFSIVSQSGLPQKISPLDSHLRPVILIMGDHTSRCMFKGEVLGGAVDIITGAGTHKPLVTGSNPVAATTSCSNHSF